MNAHDLMANTIRTVSMDAVEAAKSGHPGAPMGMADMATVLWQKHLRVNPANPKWENRDRFVLSNGHASILLYSLLHLSGFALSLEDIKRFRQFGSKTPGHPEVHEVPGVETTTGPLGQGIANAVGFALAEAHLAQQFNRDNFPIVDHYTYCFLGDGCLMEGISHEACSLAGTLGLGKLIVLYDANNVSIDGEISPWFSEDVAARFISYGWHVVGPIDGHDAEAIDAAITQAKNERNKPSFIVCKTIIGFGAPTLAGSEKSHGAPLGKSEVSATKAALGMPDNMFFVSEEAKNAADLREKGAQWQKHWQETFNAYSAKYPDLAEQYRRVMRGDLPADFNAHIDRMLHEIQHEGKTIATRKASEQALDLLVPNLPELVGGSADLTCSNLTASKASISIMPQEFGGNYVHYGVREFAMAAIMNGMVLHGGIRPYGGTFLVFSDYMRNGMRMSALMKLPVVYVLTHDSIGLGEDGPTHQPVEHIASLRLIPNFNVWRPCDSVETLVAWQQALNSTIPTALVLSRQNLPVQPRNQCQLEYIARGGYVLKESDSDITLIATGSEIDLVMRAIAVLDEADIPVRVVSMPCLEVFNAQTQDYRDSVLPPNGKKVAVEAGVSGLWQGVVGDNGSVIGINTFGASGPASALFEHYGFTVDNIIRHIRTLIN